MSTDAVWTGDRKSVSAYLKWAYIVTAAGLALGAYVGWEYSGTLGGALSTFFICGVLAALEISLSFDNAIVNANKLKTMTRLCCTNRVMAEVPPSPDGLIPQLP